ncbi:MAG: ribonuclease PH [Nitrospinae bacterium]|nr:ribonuclease PH [Nitrospinota bacterium]
MADSKKAKRADNRKPDQLRKVTIETGVNIHAEGSALISIGNTRVLCTASVEEKVPQFLRGKGSGWVTAEYSMLPRATNTRSPREAAKGKLSGRTMEIQRLIGRALRSVVKMEELGERSIWIDCDTIQADGGTRTASITGGFVAMCLALHRLKSEGKISTIPVRDYLGAVSVGIVEGRPMLDLDYAEDSTAHVDMNVVMTGKGKFVEVQGTAEREPFDRATMDRLMMLAAKGIRQLAEAQKKALPHGTLR